MVKLFICVYNNGKIKSFFNYSILDFVGITLYDVRCMINISNKSKHVIKNIYHQYIQITCNVNI